MPVNVPKGLGRRPPELPDNPDFNSKLRLVFDEIVRKVDDLAEQSTGSKHDELEFESAGDGETVRLPNKLGFIPNRMRVVSRKGSYQVGEPESGVFADEDFINVVTNAPKGTKFVVEFDRR